MLRTSILFSLFSLAAVGCVTDDTAGDDVPGGSGGKADDASAEGVFVHLVVEDELDPIRMYPDNGYFVFDDHDAFRDKYWSELTSRVADLPAPELAEGDAVVGFVTHYAPYKGKRGKVESVERVGDQMVVSYLLTWTAFGCFEGLGDLQLIDLVKVPANGLPIKIVVRTNTGTGCPGGIMVPPREPRIVHDIDVGAADTNLFRFCETTGRFTDPYTNCRTTTELPPR